MGFDRLLTVALAVALIAGLGTAAATLDASVDTTPDDVIDIDASSVPLGSGDLKRYEDRLQSGGTREVQKSGGSPESVPSSEGSGSESNARTGDGPRQERGPEQMAGPGSGDESQSFLEWLLGMLRALLDLLVRVVPVVLLLAALAAVVRKREWIASRLTPDRPEASTSDGTRGEPPTRPAPRNDVEAAFHEMATLAEVERPETATPRTCANIAVDAGADPTAVERLTSLFEEVRYGGASVTDERRSKASDQLRRVRAQLGGSA